MNLENMKKIVLAIILAAVATTSYGQTKAMGARLGVCGFEADYQHVFIKNQFLECNFGLDFGWLGQGNSVVTPNDKLGVKATAVYNFVWARPAWTNEGSWALYAGPGVTTGYVHDDGHYMGDDGKTIISFQSHGFVLGVCAQVGVEYTFWFPLQLSVDLRPTVGMHANKIEGVGFYDNGLLGFAPTISVRYCF